MRQQRSRRQGFTLIELSIVPVIIGLIVGGVLVGQDLIQAAALRAQVSQIEKYQTAVNTFRSKYGGIPGDLALTTAAALGFATSNCTGDGSSPLGGRNGNGIIEGAGLGAPLAAYMGENELFWDDLSAANLINYNVSDSRAVICTASVTTVNSNVSVYIPAGPIGGGNYLQVYGYQGHNWFMLSAVNGFSALTSGANGQPALSVNQAYNLDKKVDDGVPTTGHTVAVYVGASHTVPVLATNVTTSGGDSTSCYDTTTGAYSTSQNGGRGLNCALSFQFQ